MLPAAATDINLAGVLAAASLSFALSCEEGAAVCSSWSCCFGIFVE